VERGQVNERVTTELLSEYWTELLDVESVNPDDHLLELGGNSLIATMLANRIEAAWGFRPTMDQMLNSSFQEMSDLCEKSKIT
jgi:hypothetical protein